MSADLNDLDKRISILENEFENMETTMGKMETTVNENFESTLAIKERLDKWNGSIPHLVEDVKKVHEMQNKLFDTLTTKTISDAESNAKNTSKIKILWAVLAAAASSMLTLAIKLLVH